MATVEFSPESPGDLVGGNRFKALPQPIRLESGFEGVIVAEGYGPGEPAGNAWLQERVWAVNDADGSLVFPGKGRFGDPGSLPETVDKGPANRYAAGTFQLRVLEVIAPGKPTLSVVPSNGVARLSWPAVDRPVAAAEYEIFRATDPEGPFAQIAETTAAEYIDSGLSNGVRLSWKVRAVSANGVPGPDSDVISRTPDVVQGGVAYIAPAGTAGNQDFSGSVGNDFDVVRDVRITRLGAFDDASDGIQRPITVRLYDRSNGTALAEMTFGPDDQGELIDGSRFKDLPTPIVLPPGFQGAIVGSGYGPDEQVGNNGLPGADLGLLSFTGGSLEFVGSSRFGEAPDQFPAIPDGGPENRYAAGTFVFEPFDPLTLAIALTNGTVVLTWTGAATLETTTAVGENWETVTNAQSGITITADQAAQFFRLSQ
jgi:hypothetical protein